MWVTYLLVWDNFAKARLIPHDIMTTQVDMIKDGDPQGPIAERKARILSASW